MNSIVSFSITASREQPLETRNPQYCPSNSGSPFLQAMYANFISCRGGENAQRARRFIRGRPAGAWGTGLRGELSTRSFCPRLGAGFKGDTSESLFSFARVMRQGVEILSISRSTLRLSYPTLSIVASTMNFKCIINLAPLPHLRQKHASNFDL